MISGAAGEFARGWRVLASSVAGLAFGTAPVVVNSVGFAFPLLQRETGGNLAALLDSLSKLIRERMKLLGTIKVLSAEGRLSAQILTALPFLLAFAIHLINPEFLQVLWTDSAGIKLVSIALLMILGGIYWMRRIIKIRI